MTYILSRISINFFIIIIFHFHLTAQQNPSALKTLDFLAIEHRIDSFLEIDQFDSVQIYAQVLVEKASLESNEEVLVRGYSILANSAFQQLDFVAAKFYYDEIINLSTIDSIKVKYLLQKGRAQLRENQPDSVFYVIEHLKQLITEEMNDEYWFEFHRLQANYYKSMTNLLVELEHWQRAKERLKPTQTKKLISVNHSISIIYYRIEAFEAALAIVEENLAIALSQKDYLAILYAYYEISDISIRRGNLEVAKEYCYKAMKVKDEQDISRAFGYNYMLLGSIFFKENKLDSAKYYFQKGIDISIKQKENKELADNYAKYSELLLLQKDTFTAKKLLLKSLSLRSYHDDKIKSLLSEIYANEASFDKAYELLRENWVAYEMSKKDNSLYQVTSALIQEKYEQEKKMLVWINEQKLRTQKLRLLFGGFILFMGIAIFIIINQKRTSKRLKKMNELLTEKNDDLVNFAYICFHDLREPIKNISSFTFLINENLKQESLNQHYEEYFNFIQKSIKTLLNIVESLRQYTQIGNKKHYKKSKISTDLFFQNLIKGYANLAKEKNATIRFTNGMKGKNIYSSKEALNILLQNLIKNGLTYNKSDVPKIDITLTNASNHYLITVKDNGNGIEENYLEYIFQPFKTLQNKSINSSSGLGLAICKRLVSTLGGKIWATSKVGKGSTFFVKLNY